MNTRARIPGDVDRPDRILAGLTGRQLGILAVAGLVVWAGFLATSTRMPLPAYALVAAPVALAAAVLTFGRCGGLPADRMAVAAWRWWRGPRRLVPAPAGVARLPRWLRASDGEDDPGPLSLPVRDVHPGGLVDLGRDGTAVICAVSSPNFALRTAEEQAAVTAAVGRWLNGLRGPVQLITCVEQDDPDAAVAELEEAAGGLPDPALEAVARDHARYLGSLASSGGVLVRRTYLVLREPGSPESAAAALARRVEEAAGALAAAGITVEPLAAGQTAELLASACGRPSPCVAGGGIVIGASP